MEDWARHTEPTRGDLALAARKRGYCVICLLQTGRWVVNEWPHETTCAYVNQRVDSGNL